MLKTIKSTHGGKRKNSGAKLKYGEPTKLAQFLLPESKFEEIKNKIKNLLKSYVVIK